MLIYLCLSSQTTASSPIAASSLPVGVTDGQIILPGIRVHANHVVLPSERELGQLFSADVTLDVDMDTDSDDITKAVNYATVAQQVLNVLAGEPVNLIETLAGRIADTVLGMSPRVRSVQVTVHKPHAPVGVALDDVAVMCRKDAE